MAVMSPEQTLMNHILANHSTYGRPIQDPDQAVNVSIQLYLTQILRMVSKRFYLDFNEDISVSNVTEC